MARIKADTPPPKREVPLEIQYVDAPMACCGLGMGQGITERVKTGEFKESAWHRGWYDEVHRDPTKADIRTRLHRLKLYGEDNGRNTVMVTIASWQADAPYHAKEAAEEEGFRCIHEFYNPNSGNQVYIMVYTNYANFEEYKAAVGSDQDEDF